MKTNKNIAKQTKRGQKEPKEKKHKKHILTQSHTYLHIQ